MKFRPKRGRQQTAHHQWIDTVVDQQTPFDRSVNSGHSHTLASLGLILVNMFTNNVKRRKRGRPPGQSPQGAAARERLYETAIRLISERGYEATTLRDIAQAAGVSVGLLYRYFPSKQAVIVALYDQLSADFAQQAAALKPGKWRDRFV